MLHIQILERPPSPERVGASVSEGTFMMADDSHRSSDVLLSTSRKLLWFSADHDQHPDTGQRFIVFGGRLAIQTKQARDSLAHILESLGERSQFPVGKIGELTIFPFLLKYPQDPVLELSTDLKLSIEELEPNLATLFA